MRSATPEGREDAVKRSALSLAVLASLVAPTGAQAKPAKQYVLKHPKREHCRAHYVRKVEKVKRREQGRTVKVRETFCVSVSPNAPAKTATPSATVRLRALDPSFTQNPANPLIVTYSYSASADQESGGVALPDTNLPSGVLAFYSDGLLSCSINVGGSVSGGQCTVGYRSFGTHTIDVVYSSGENSATTGPETVTIVEPPIIPTTTTQTVQAEGCKERPYVEQIKQRVCDYTVAATTIAQDGPQLTESRAIRLTRTAPHEISEVSFGIPAGAAGCHVETIEVLPAEGITLRPIEAGAYSSDCPGSSTHGYEEYATSWSVLSVFGGTPGPLAFPLGWAASESASQTLPTE